MAAAPLESQDPGCADSAACEAVTHGRAMPAEGTRTEITRTEGARRGDTRLEEITPSTPTATLEAARQLLLEYGQFVMAQPGAGRFCFGTLREEAEGLPLSFIRQGGGSLLALVRGEPAGFVAWRILSAPSAAPGFSSDSWELKRLWVRPSARGFALGRLLTQAVLDRARAAGRKAIYLDTAPQSMAAAHRLYLDMGFAPCAAYNDNPVEGLVWMVKFL
ncbi:MAG TPA: GNAT family N-acetyltransferase [Terracidiphilus sp.]|nr:GNAT family N-acetyltransferase [Terracidiphilus sp.]